MNDEMTERSKMEYFEEKDTAKRCVSVALL